MKKQLIAVTAILLLAGCTTNPSPNPTSVPPSVKPTTTASSTQAPDISAKWKSHTLPAVGLSFKLPPKLDSLGEVKQEIVSGTKGTQLCVQFVKAAAWYSRLIPEVEAGGGCSTTQNPYIYMATTSTDYEAGREGIILDAQGFVKQANKYLIRFPGDRITEAFPQNKITAINNSNGVEVIKIAGTSKVDDGPTITNSLGDRTAALVNTKDKSYPGFGFLFEKTLNQDEIDGILMSLKFTK